MVRHLQAALAVLVLLLPAEVRAELPGTEALPGEIPVSEGIPTVVTPGEGEADATEEVVVEALPSRVTLAGVELRCPLRRCEPGFEFHDRLLTAIELGAGDTITPADVQWAVRVLSGIGFFRSIEVGLEETAEGSLLVFDLEPHVLVRRVRVRGSTALADEVRRRVLLRRGQVWEPESEVVRRQEQALKDFFERRGWFAAEVELVVTELNPWLVDVDIHVRPGQRLRVNRIHIRGNEYLDYEELRDVVLGEFNFLQSFTADRFLRAQEAVVRRYREEGFLQARVVRQGFRLNRETRTADLYVDIREGEQWRVEFRGNEVFRRRELLTGLGFWESGILDEEELRSAVREIQARYATVGHLFAAVEVEQRVEPDGVRLLRFTIEENARSEILSVNFEGLTALRPSEVREAWETSVYSIFTPGGYLQWTLLERDLSVLESMLMDRGHLSARVERVVLVAERGGRDLHVTVFVNEGPRTLVRSVEVEGDEELEGGDVRGGLSLVSGEAFAPGVLAEDQARLRALREGERYTIMDVESGCVGDDGALGSCLPPAMPAECRFNLTVERGEACERTETSDGVIVQECRRHRAAEACRPLEVAAPVDLLHRLDVRLATTFGEVFIRGAHVTNARVVRRELPFEAGEPFDARALLEGQSSLRALGLFNSVRLLSVGLEEEGSSPVLLDEDEEALGEPEEERPVVISVQLEETSYRSVDYRVGLESRVTALSDVLILQTNQASWRDINVLGSAMELRVVGDLDLDIVTPSRLVEEEEFDAGLRLIWFDPRFRGFGLFQRPWEARSEVFWSQELLAPPPNPQIRQIGLDLRARREFQRRSGLFFQLGLSLRRVDSRDQSDITVARPPFERALILSIIPRVTLERRDNPLNPTRGFFGEASLEIADDFFQLLNSQEFTKLSLRASQFVPLGGRGFVLGTNGRLGLATGGVTEGLRPTPDGFSLPVSERFRLGGVNSLRGFGEGAIRAPGSDGFGGDIIVAGNVELRYPFLQALGLNGAVFLDAGQLGLGLGDLAISELRWATGFGVRWLIADLIPLVLDYGIALDRRLGEGAGRVHFNIGYTF